VNPDARNGWRLGTHEGEPELLAPEDAPGRGLRADWRELRVPGGLQALRGQPLGRAVGSGARTAIDATAGLGFDAFALAAIGLQVEAVEREPWVRALLERAHSRAAADAALAPIAARVRIVAADARELLASHQPVDVVLLDPMFPAKRKSDAKPPKAMQALAAVVGADQDSDALLLPALTVARQRVVVKRPRQAPPLANLKPAWTIEGKLLRFDVYRGQAKG
jgi:16S rRNA (guanine1516-N2)-methyltransferase